MTVYFDKVNAAGGIDGHNVVLISKDDAYDPNKTPPLVTELIEQDKMMASILQVGTPNVAATRALYEESCTPQLLRRHRLPGMGRPDGHQWTIGGILAYNTEAVMWADFIASKSREPMSPNSCSTTTSARPTKPPSRAIAPRRRDFEVVETQLHEGTATDDRQRDHDACSPRTRTSSSARRPARSARSSSAGLAAGGYQGIAIISATCASVASFFKPVDPAGNGVYILGQQKDPSDPQWAEDPADGRVQGRHGRVRREP